jgi:prevent-host-death family protein
MQKVSATDFNAQCLALMDEVAETGKELLIAKRGKPVAKLAPVHSKV